MESTLTGEWEPLNERSRMMQLRPNAITWTNIKKKKSLSIFLLVLRLSEPWSTSRHETKSSPHPGPAAKPCSLCVCPSTKPFSRDSPTSQPLLGTGEQSSPFLNGPQLKQVQKCEACKLRKNSAPAAHHGRMIQEAKLCLIKSENFLQMNFSRIMPSLALQYYTQACSRSLTGTYFVVNLHKGLCERAQACHTHVI